jgi:hydrogenase-4 component B
MILLLMSAGVLVLSGVLALLAMRRGVIASLLGVVGVIAAALLGLVPVLRSLFGAPAESWQLDWALPVGSFFVELDFLSAFFLLPILGLSVLAAIYGVGYLHRWEGRRRIGAAWFFFNLLIASMILVTIARNGLLFLLAWEIMAVTSFFLVTFEMEEKSVQEAGWTYLVATHLGTAFLLFLFLWLGQLAGSLDFDAWMKLDKVPPAISGALFLLAVIGFGTKAGFVPFHVWLPEAHPAAPSHVSALMSGVMIKTGLYGLIRMLTLLGPPPLWWGWVLTGMGLVSCLIGVLSALAQHDLKRLLAYSSVENVGIMTLGMGLGVLGYAGGMPALAVLGWTGCFLHVLNHSMFKGLLFMSAGSILHGTGSRLMDRLGGVGKDMPWTAAAFLVGATAICGLPPLNGFLSELLILWGAFKGASGAVGNLVAPSVAVLAGLGLVSGLAVAVFTKAFGAIFLGESRTLGARQAVESNWIMLGPMWVLAAGCLAMSFFAPMLIRLLRPVVLQVGRFAPGAAQHDLDLAMAVLNQVVWISYVLVLLVMGLASLRFWILQRRTVSVATTWGCGYLAPTPRMQYTGSSFVNPLTNLFGFILRHKSKLELPQGYFPAAASLKSEPADLVHGEMYRPAFTRLSQWLGRLRWLQQGQVQWYVLYIAVILLILLVWKLR